MAKRSMKLAALFFAILIPCTKDVIAENIDPLNDGSQYAYAENLGWMNAEPLGEGGPGIQVMDTALTGWMWGENVGWMSLSCAGTASCAAAPYGVANDGRGVLSGYGWGENVGWVSFSCANTSACAGSAWGVRINPLTGAFSGQAWSENAGWITFASTGPTAYAVRTGWRCANADGDNSCALDDCDDGNPATYPGAPETNDGLDNQCPGSPGYGLIDELSGVVFFPSPGSTQFCWLGQSGASLYQVARSTLRDFSTCVTFTTILNMTCFTDGALPPPGGRFYYLVRPLSPHGGSWGADSQGVERVLPCSG